MDGQEQDTVVEAQVDAGQVLSGETNETGSETPIDGAGTVGKETVDASKPDNVGEAIKREVERREAKLRAEMEGQVKSAAQAARDAYIAEQNYEWNGKPIKTESEYKQALREKELFDQYQEQGLPDDVVKELVESKKFREQYENDRKQSEASQKQQSEFKVFLDAYPDIKPDEIPPGVWEDVNKGTRLVDAYARHENKLLKEKLAEIEQGKQIEQQNQLNAASSTGSVTGQGEGKPAVFTREQVAAMSTAETNRHWDAIQASMKSWTKS